MNFIKVVFVNIVFCLPTFTSTIFSAVTTDDLKFNQLNKVEIVNNGFSIQILFDFAKEVAFERTKDEKNRLIVQFKGMSPNVFNADMVIETIKKLKDKDEYYGILQDVNVKAENSGVVPVMSLILTFASTITIENRVVKNDWTSMWTVDHNKRPNDPSFRVLLDILPTELKNTIEHRSTVGTIMFTENNVPGKKKILA